MGGMRMANVNCLRCRFRHEDNGNCTAVGGFCTAVQAAHCPLLREYLDTALTPEEAKRMSNILMDVGIDYNCNWEYVKNWLLDDRLRELAEADKDGRVVVLPCQSGEHVFALLDGQKHVRECEVKYALLDGWLKIFYIEPIGAPENSYSVPFGAFGQTVFLTREEAEAALEAMKDE